jgi:sterol desaturase/sphingolipid hydroxylase (fatty acid hydroxylase superfamily)
MIPRGAVIRSPDQDATCLEPACPAETALRGLNMRLSRFGYFFDFFAYPALLIALGFLGTHAQDARRLVIWATVYLAAMAFWTLLEYLLHRFALHHLPVLRQMHHRHHVEEEACDGTPTWISIPAFGILAFLPSYFIFNFFLASAITDGLMSGYLWYISVHHLLHHRRPDPPGYASNLRRRHALHHHFDETTNFGVTSGFWDHVFRTHARVSAR